MTIAEIKAQLPIDAVLTHYGLTPDRNGRLHCPFHEDKTPSMQVYPAKHTAYCFSSNCRAHGKPIDVIDFIELKEACTKAEAIAKAKTFVNGGSEYRRPQAEAPPPQATSAAPCSEETKAPNITPILQQLERTFSASIWHSPQARDYCQHRALNIAALKGHIGFNSGQFHQSSRKDETLIRQCVAAGMLTPLQRTNNQTGEAVTYRVFAKHCLTFLLRNREGAPVGLYGRSIYENSNAKHFYLPGRAGLYPHYPHAATQKLILTESILDAATLLQLSAITAQYSILALYGTNGLTQEHVEAIQALPQLAEIIFALDSDDAGTAAMHKHYGTLQSLLPKLTFTTVALPCKDLNEVAQSHEDLSVFEALLSERQPPKLPAAEEPKEPSVLFVSPEIKTPAAAPQTPTPQTPTPQPPPTKPATSAAVTATALLKQKHLLQNLNTLIGQSGIVGEDTSRLLLFLITLSYLNKSPLHAIVQGSSGSGKTHLISRIADLMPPEDVLRFTRITESSLYNWGEFDLIGKVIVIEDLDGLKEDALYALRELISNQRLSSSVTIKDKHGNHKSARKEVQGQFSSLSATTRGQTYEDNMSRSFLIAVDETPAQTARIIAHQNRRVAGELNRTEAQQAATQVQQLVRALQPREIVNPYATRLQLPDKVHKIRRLNEMYQAVIKQVTLLHPRRQPRRRDQRRRAGHHHPLRQHRAQGVRAGLSQRCPRKAMRESQPCVQIESCRSAGGPMYYAGLKKIADASLRNRIVAGLQRLRLGLSSALPSRTVTDSLLLATWNIREFDSGKYGYRGEEPYFYIAEILSRFDLIAIQEVRDGLYPLQTLVRILGSDWDFLVTDVTLGTAGNSERMAYLFDRRKVGFTGMAAELVLPKANGAKEEPVQMARSPYVAGFRAGWAYLTLATVHIYYGDDVAVDPRRLAEITAFAKTIAKNASKLNSAPQYQPGALPTPDNLIMLGDFNIFNREDVTMQAITDAGFVVPPALQQVPGSNVDKNKHYDQIAWYQKLSRLKPTGRAGVFDYYEHVYRLADEADYAQDRAQKPGRSFKEWRTYRMSDHLPMWIELGIDDADAYLASLVAATPPVTPAPPTPPAPPAPP